MENEFKYYKDNWFTENVEYEFKTPLGVMVSNVVRDRDKNNLPTGRAYAPKALWVFAETVPSRKIVLGSH